MQFKYVWRIVKIAVPSLVLLIILLGSFQVVGPTERGIRITLGSADDTVLESGVHLKWPLIQHIETISIQPIQTTYNVEVNHDGAITKDNQTVGSNVTVFYKYKNDGTPVGSLVNMYKNFGEKKIQDVVYASIREAFKQVIGKYTIFDIAMSQAKIQEEFRTLFTEKIAYLPITITDSKITNYDWSDQFDNQIQETMSKAQQVKQAEQDKLITEQQSQKLVVQAESEKKALVTKAEGDLAKAKLDAEAKVVAGEAIQKYNQAVEANITTEIRFRELANERARIDKWNGAFVANNNYGPIPVQTGVLQKP